MNYAIRHLTRFEYTAPISESVMEVYMQPRSDANQRLLSFDLSVSPQANTHQHEDYLGNVINHFNVPRSHTRLTITAESMVEVRPASVLPAPLDESAWALLDEEVEADDLLWEMLMPSKFVVRTPLVDALAAEVGVNRQHDPLTALGQLNEALYQAFDYAPQTTLVDSPIDDALKARRGVCQDFAHIMLALSREYLRVPCRYVSGYLYTGADDDDRSADDASHAWVEAYLPGLGWLGFDPTNNLLVTDARHIRVAVGRDYADVPPTRGVFKGEADTELSVGVQVKLVDDVPFDDDLLPALPDMHPYEMLEHHQQMQQQQQ